MKCSLNFWLVTVFLLSIPACIAAWLLDIRWIFVLPAVPMFCLQLWLCRMTKRLPARLIPVVLECFPVGTALFLFFRDHGWDRLGAVILGLASISPFVGILLAWAIYGWSSRRPRAAAEEDC